MGTIKKTMPFIAAMAAVVVASNILVSYPFDYFGLTDLLTWGAFTYPIAFLVNDLTNRRFGLKSARLVIYAGFFLAVILSVVLASPRIAIASGTAFLCAQLFDATIFDRLRALSWWKAPIISTIAGSALDTVLFFSLAFSEYFSVLDVMTGQEDGSLGFPVAFMGTEVPLWVSLAFGDFWVKIATGVAMLLPYGILMNRLQPANAPRPA
ncbi:MAG: VUT family protein [Rhizobiaceae bacterium]